MTYHTGIDFSLEGAIFCIMEAAGSIMKEACVAREPEAIVALFEGLAAQGYSAGIDRSRLFLLVAQHRPVKHDQPTVGDECARD